MIIKKDVKGIITDELRYDIPFIKGYNREYIKKNENGYGGQIKH